MQEDITELRNLPLEQLIAAPLNAVIKAQAQAAMTTAQFIEEIGFKRPDDDSFFDTPDTLSSNDYEVRVAKLHVDANGKATNVDIPFITLFNVPNFEITNFDWSFNVKLKSMQSFSAKFGTSTTTTTSGNAGGSLSIFSMLKIGGGMKVETTTKTDFESRFKSGREQEYNLSINIKGNSAPLPKGIETLLNIAEAAAKAEPVTPP
ncbi:MAG: DUF2589 domain-containing protein [Holophagaceae bacterium]